MPSTTGGRAPRIEPHGAYSLLTLGYMAAIYWLSSQPDFGVAGRSAVARIAWNLAHVPVYAGLAFCLLRALSGGRWRPELSWELSGLALMVAGGYGALDEWHQSFVPGRFVSAGDVLLDLVRAGAMVLRLRLAAARAEAGTARLGGRPPFRPAMLRAGVSGSAEEGRT